MYNKLCLKFRADSGCFERIKNFIRNTAKRKYHATKSSYFTHCVSKINNKPHCFFEGAFHFIPTSGKTLLFQEVELREGRSPVINQTQSIRVVADNTKQRFFTTALNKAQPSVYATRKENHKILVSQIDVLDPETIEHKNCRFGENKVKSLCNILRLNK